LGHDLANIDIDEAEIDREAAAILRSATEAVQAILERRAELDREGQYDMHLVVLAGDDHAMPAHKIHHILVLKGLAEKLEKRGDKVVFGFEREHNLLSNAFFEATKRQVDPDITRRLQEHDLDGALSLQYFSGFFGTRYADNSLNILFRFLRNHSDKIVSRFTDAAESKIHLDQSDPSTAHSMNTCPGATISVDISYTSPEGVRIRNHHIATMIEDFATTQNARIVVQQCGNVHVAGDKSLDFSASYSLSACFRVQNTPIIAMPIFSSRGLNENNIPVDHGLEDEEKLFRTDLPEKQAIYDPYMDTPIVGQPAEFENRAAEATWVNALLERVGLKNECMSVDEYHENHKSLADDTRAQFSSWERQFYDGI